MEHTHKQTHAYARIEYKPTSGNNKTYTDDHSTHPHDTFEDTINNLTVISAFSKSPKRAAEIISEKFQFQKEPSTWGKYLLVLSFL